MYNTPNKCTGLIEKYVLIFFIEMPTFSMKIKFSMSFPLFPSRNTGNTRERTRLFYFRLIVLTDAVSATADLFPVYASDTWKSGFSRGPCRFTSGQTKRSKWSGEMIRRTIRAKFNLRYRRETYTPPPRVYSTGFSVTAIAAAHAFSRPISRRANFPESGEFRRFARLRVRCALIVETSRDTFLTGSEWGVVVDGVEDVLI